MDQNILISEISNISFFKVYNNEVFIKRGFKQ
jgi:hypothetical protein